jgi:hypothetical protein
MISDIDHVQIAAPKGCEAKARSFFGDLLQLVEIEKPESLRGRVACLPNRICTLAAGLVPLLAPAPALSTSKTEIVTFPRVKSNM